MILDQLWEFYEKEEYHKKRISKTEADKYHQHLLDRGNIITVSDGDILCGYVEFWKLNFEQLGRIICGDGFSAYLEDVQTGYIAYCANVYIRPEYRRSHVIRILHDRFYEINECCSYFVGEARSKKFAPLKVTRKEEIMHKFKVEV